MAHLIFFDDDKWKSLLPLTYLKPACELRVGVLTIAEKWNRLFQAENHGYITKDYLSQKYKLTLEDTNIAINGRLLPNANVISLLNRLKPNQGLLYQDTFIGGILSKSQFNQETYDIDIDDMEIIDISSYDQRDIIFIDRPQDIFLKNASEIVNDFDLITKNRTSQELNDTNRYYGLENIFIEEGAKVDFAILNASDGPIYIGKDATVLENSVIKGPVAIGDNAVVKVAAKIYQGTTLGPYCKVGGEVKSTVFQGYSSKAHDGYLGDTVIGEWCNLGADTNCSNLKNNYAEVKAYQYDSEEYELTGLQFCGMILGDHCKTSINSMFNTGSVIGISCNLFGTDFPPKFVPSFGWGGHEGFETYKFEKSLDAINRSMQRRNLRLSDIEIDILKYVFEESKDKRSWEND